MRLVLVLIMAVMPMLMQITTQKKDTLNQTRLCLRTTQS